MNILMYPIILIAALTAKAGTFSFYLGTKKKTCTVVESQHLAPLGKFSLSQASSLASQIASGNLDVKVRIGADDYEFIVADAT